MGRAIVRQADAFLFDEPLSNLDAKLRGQMRTEISRMQRRLGTTTVYVTHDQVEAMTLGDRIAVMRKGILQQVGSPRELYERPANLFVAGFIGSPPMNFIPGAVTRDGLETAFGTVPLNAETAARVAGSELALVGVRPEHFEDADLLPSDQVDRGMTLEAKVDVTEWLGNELYAYVPYEAPPEIEKQLVDLIHELDMEQMHTQLVVALDPMSRVRDGDRARLWFNPARAHIFNPTTGENLTAYDAMPAAGPPRGSGDGSGAGTSPGPGSGGSGEPTGPAGGPTVIT
jgi:multiple sugar transport system ATP-binding protein